MMTDAPTGHFQSIVLQPHAGQFVIDELPAIVLCCAAWVYGGMEGLPLTALAVSKEYFGIFMICFLLFYSVNIFTCWPSTR